MAAKKAAPKPAGKSGGLPPWLTPGGPGAKKPATKKAAKTKASYEPQSLVATYSVRKNGRTVKKVTGTVDVAYQIAKNWARRSIRKTVPVMDRTDWFGSFDSRTKQFGYRIVRM